MTQTLTQTITNVRSLLDEPNPQFWSDAELTTWINGGCRDVARKAEWKWAVQSVPVTAGTNTYTGPADMYRIHRVEFNPTGSTNTYTVEFRGYMEMDQIWGINQQWPASYPLYYTLWKNPPAIQMILYPVPSQAGALSVKYYQEATPASGSANIDVLEGWEDTVEDYAAYRALRKDADPRWQEFKATYDEKLQALYDTSRTYQDQAGTFTTGQAALPTWLVSDGLY